MKKFYFLAAAAAVALSSAAADYTVSASRNNAGLKPADIKEAASTSRITITDSFAATAQVKASVKADEADVDEGWTSLGTGTWVEGPLDYFSDLKSGVTHELEIFQSTENPNIYRMLPYGEGSAPAELLGRVNESWFYVNVADPTKVLGYGDFDEDGDWAPFMAWLVSPYTQEAGWGTNANGYGIYDETEKTISFPAGSFRIQLNSKWLTTNADGKFMIYLPGAEVKDYSFNSEADVCNDNNVIRFMAEIGKDVAGLKYLLTPGTYDASAGNLGIAATDGHDMEAEKIYTFAPAASGVYTIFIVAVDANGKVIDGASHWVHILNDEAGQWEEVGTGVWTDPILKDGGYLNTQPDLEVVVERSINDENLLRISSPYAPYFADNAVSHSGHEHYIYIDITDPEAVVVDLSLTGLDAGNGHIRVWSTTSRFAGNSAATIKGAGFGVPSYDETTNTISFPAKSLFYSEPYYANGSWFAASPAGQLVLPEVNKVPDALSIVGDLTSPVAMTKDGNKFTASNVRFVAAGDALYASFTLQADDANYGAVADDVVLAVPATVAFEVAAEAKAWQLNPGNYDITVDFDEMTIAVVANSSSVDAIDVDAANASVEYFNLQGVRVAEPANGLYIVRRGDKVAKEVIK